MPRRSHRGAWPAGALVLGFSLPATGAVAQRTPLVHPGATVRVTAPSVGSQTYLGRYATAQVRGTLCHGAAVVLPGSDAPALILLKGITRLEVDRRTNVGAAVVGLGDPAPEDWETVELAALRAEDSTCAVRERPGG